MGHIDGLLDADDIGVIAALGNLSSSTYAVAGYPAVTVPAGLRPLAGPQGLTLTGGYLTDDAVLGYA